MTVGTKSLDNFDADIASAALSSFGGDTVAVEGKRIVLLDSPRSVEACLRLGLSPFDFVPPQFDEVVRRMKDTGESVEDPSIVKMRYSYLVQRSKQKLRAACEERVRIMVEKSAQSERDGNRSFSSTSAAAAPCPGQQQADNSTRIQEEEKRLQKIVENNKNRLRQQLLHTQLIEKQREREEQKLMSQRRDDELQKKNRVREMIERSKKEEEAQALRNEARELERREQQARVELKRAMYEAKDKQVKDRIQRQRLEAEAENEAKRLLNLERQKQMKEQADALLVERRKEFQRRNEAFEASQEEFRHQLEVRKEERLAVARIKQRKIREAIQRSNDQQAAKIQRALEKERLADELRRQQEEIAAEKLRLKNQMEEEKERQRQAVVAEAQAREAQRVADLQAKLEATEHHMQTVAEQREAEMRVRSEVQRQKELDKLDCVQRSKFMEEHRISLLEKSSIEKVLRVERLQEQQEILKEKRKLHREEAERTRVVIQEVTPGPSDFIVTIGDIANNDRPKWKMGLPATTMMTQVVQKNVPAPGYMSSPGPCVYEYERFLDSKHRKPEAFSMIKHDRWQAASEALRTPGPADYAPQTPSFIQSRQTLGSGGSSRPSSSLR